MTIVCLYISSLLFGLPKVSMLPISKLLKSCVLCSAQRIVVFEKGTNQHGGKAAMKLLNNGCCGKKEFPGADFDITRGSQ